MFKVLSILCIFSGMLFAQDKDAFSTDDSKKTGLFDPSRLTVQNSVSFGAMSSGFSSKLQSQSLYTTMMRYQFTAPVTLNLNFSLPIHSTFSPMQNLTSNNMQSLEYFKSMPFEMTVAWQPTRNTSVQFSILKTGAGDMFSGNYGGYRPLQFSKPAINP